MRLLFAHFIIVPLLCPAAVILDVSASAASGVSNTSATASIRVINGVVQYQTVGGDAAVTNEPWGPGSGKLGVSAITQAFGVPPAFTRSNAVASVDLTTAALRVDSENVAISPANGQSTGQARYLEYLTFTNNTPGVLGLGFQDTVSGQVTGSVASAFIYNSLQLAGYSNAPRFGDGSLVLGEVIQFNFNQGISSFTSNAGTPGAHWILNADGNGGGSMAGVVLFNPGVTLLSIQSVLNVVCGDVSKCMYGNTSLFRFDTLPDGLSFTSESGVFLTAANESSVPEPSCAALAGIGIAIVTYFRRRKAR